MAEVHIIGTIMGCSDFKEPAGLFCRWSIETGVVEGAPWQLLGGTCSGNTHVDSSGGEGADATWSHPLDVHFGCPSVVGWPRLRLEVWSRDSMGSNVLCGYGFCNCPMSPGKRTFEVVTWVPVGGAIEKLSSFFLGIKPQLQDSSIVSNTKPGEGRFGLKCSSSGVVYVELEVLTANLEKNGVQT